MPFGSAGKVPRLWVGVETSKSLVREPLLVLGHCSVAQMRINADVPQRPMDNSSVLLLYQLKQLSVLLPISWRRSLGLSSCSLDSQLCLRFASASLIYHPTLNPAITNLHRTSHHSTKSSAAETDNMTIPSGRDSPTSHPSLSSSRLATMASHLGRLWKSNEVELPVSTLEPLLQETKESGENGKCDLRIEGMTCGSCVEVRSKCLDTYNADPRQRRLKACYGINLE
jgi:hypothetical protein